MTIAHHPNETLLAAYAAGAVDQGQHVALATHLFACARCRDLTRSLEGVGGALLCDEPAAAMADDALARTLSRLDDAPPFAGLQAPAVSQAPAASQARAVSRGPEVTDAPPLLPHFVKTYRFGPWRWVAPRVSVRPIALTEESPTRVFLLKVAPGTKLLQHAHVGLEMTCVLTGAFRQEDGVYRPGDFDFGDETVQHQPIIEAGEDCVSLVAMQGELRWNGLLGRLLQPFMRL